MPTPQTAPTVTSYYYRDKHSGMDKTITDYFSNCSNLSSFYGKFQPDGGSLTTMQTTNTAVCNSLDSVHTQLGGVKNDLFSNWQGDSAATPQKHLDNIIEGINRVYDSMSQDFTPFLTNCLEIWKSIETVETDITTLNGTPYGEVIKYPDGTEDDHCPTAAFSTKDTQIANDCTTIDTAIQSLIKGLEDSNIDFGIVGNLQTDLGTYNNDHQVPPSLTLPQPPTTQSPQTVQPTQPTQTTQLVSKADVAIAFAELDSDSSEDDVLAFIDVLTTAYLQGEVSDDEYKNYCVLLATNTDVDFVSMGGSSAVYLNASEYAKVLNQFSKNPDYLGTHDYQELMNFSGNYDDALDELKKASNEGEQNFYALAAVEQLRKEVFSGKTSVTVAKQAMKDMEQYCKLKQDIIFRTALGEVWDAVKVLFDQVDRLRTSSQ